jgi:hypothetical protein
MCLRSKRFGTTATSPTYSAKGCLTNRVGEGEWWDTTGVGIVPEAVVDEYMRLNNVGIVVLEDAGEEVH